MEDNIHSSIKNQNLLAERRRQIVAVATKLFMAQGYEGTSMRDIARGAGLTIGALYRYIGAKEDLRWLSTHIADDYNRKFHERLEQLTKELKPMEALKESLKLYFQGVDRQQDLYNFHNHIVWTASKELRQSIFDRERRMVEYFNRILEQGVGAGDFEIEDTFLIAHNIVITGNAWANRRWLLRKRYMLEDYIQKEIGFILKGIQPKKVINKMDATCAICIKTKRRLK